MRKYAPTKKFAQVHKGSSSDDDDEHRGGRNRFWGTADSRQAFVKTKSENGLFLCGNPKNLFSHLPPEKWSKNAAKRIYNVLRGQSSAKNVKDLLQSVRDTSGDDLHVTVIDKLLRDSSVDEWISHRGEELASKEVGIR